MDGLEKLPYGGLDLLKLPDMTAEDVEYVKNVFESGSFTHEVKDGVLHIYPDA